LRGSFFMGLKSMNQITSLENMAKPFFYFLNGMPSFIGLEEKQMIEREDFVLIVKELVELGSENQLKRVGIHLRKEFDTYSEFASILIERKFQRFTSSVEYRKELAAFTQPATHFSHSSLNDDVFTEEEFKSFWMLAMSGSGNQRSTLTMDEHLESVKNELGAGWKENCVVFYSDGRPIAVSIPHIEPGTVNEGRLFYFGLLPEERGKGYASLLHKYSLYLLKQMGAAYYIGSTHVGNKAMQRIFEKSGCLETGRKSSYYYYY
jgi:RimJ/RimL family protein N-acetyltransferase